MVNINSNKNSRFSSNISIIQLFNYSIIQLFNYSKGSNSLNTIYTTLLIGICAFLSACTMNPKVTVDNSLNENNAGKVIVYRPSTAWAGAAIDYRVSLNSHYVGSLDTGRHIEFLAPVGANSVDVEDYFMGVGNKKFTLPLEINAGQEYYIRFSQHIDNVVYTANGSIISGGTRLALVSAEQWEKRK